MVELLILLSRYYQRHQTNESLDHNQDTQNLIRRICGYIERHYDEKINRTSLAYLFRISSRQLNRIFKKETGVPVVTMIQRVRMNQAKKLLLETNEKIITVAGLVGYDDAAFFSKLFSRQEGCSPGDYRKKNKITI
jgi:AraC family L-rhamnose operon regulatory protein RhaS